MGCQSAAGRQRQEPAHNLAASFQYRLFCGWLPVAAYAQLVPVGYYSKRRKCSPGCPAALTPGGRDSSPGTGRSSSGGRHPAQRARPVPAAADARQPAL
jgi:hypothetical protein